MKLDPPSLEWALQHVQRFYSSDFFPEPFELKAIADKWEKTRAYLLEIELDTYIPKTPLQMLAPKPNGTFRVVHQLDPLDALIYTALVHSVAKDIEANRIPASEGIACSYRFFPDVNGSFFSPANDGWEMFTQRTQNLIDKYTNGVILVCDIVDFYNQIYSHRVRNAIGELSRPDSELLGVVIERFIQGLSTATSRGIPVGPAASILLAEAVMADVDRKILTYTRDYVRWVDDIRIFLTSRDDAQSLLHDLTSYLHDNHRLVLSGEKTQIMSVKEYQLIHDGNDQKKEEKMMIARSEILVLEQHSDKLFSSSDIYGYGIDDDFDHELYKKLLEELQKSPPFELASSAYSQLLKTEIAAIRPDYILIRRILRNARAYRIRSLLPDILESFHIFLPVIRETCLYLEKVLSPKVAEINCEKFITVLRSPAAKLRFINTWLSWILTHEAFNVPGYENIAIHILSVRDKALVALRAKDRTWVKTHKNGLDTLGPYEKRAVLYSSQALSSDERRAWLNIAKVRGEFLESILADSLLGKL